MPESVPANLPKLGRGVLALMVAFVVASVATAVLARVSPDETLGLRWLAFEPSFGALVTRPWTLITSGFVGASMNQLLMGALGMYFIGPSLEARWGTARLVRFSIACIVLGNLVALASTALPATWHLLHPAWVWGPATMIGAWVVAWADAYRDGTLRLFFMLPVPAWSLTWITLGFAALALLFGAPPSEGALSITGGVVAAKLVGGSPSLFRRAWLQLRLRIFHRRATRMTVSELLRDANAPPSTRGKTASAKRSRAHLTLVPTDDDDLKKRKVPKDKRYLN